MTQFNLFSEDAAKSLKKEKPMTWSPTREAGLARLAEFVPYAGIAYTRSRNTDFGRQIGLMFRHYPLGYRGA